MKKFNTLTAILAALTLCSCSSTPSTEPTAQESQVQDSTDSEIQEQTKGHEGNIELVYAISGELGHWR